MRKVKAHVKNSTKRDERNRYRLYGPAWKRKQYMYHLGANNDWTQAGDYKATGWEQGL